ncbi:hypothetical protein EVAR_90681_1 [Eumeta japonica]|uniref:Uncharacterized protein n=1 Tax=Eumeta variegata TaxID=151549 RepID=A0A4C1YZ82_EUMVA|nr:hypothetical protein EVAR_90681_1 [Eumeta japonica]
MSNPPAISDTAPNPNMALTGKTTKIVLNLLEGLEHIVSRWTIFISPALARYLKCRGFDCLGTERLTSEKYTRRCKEMKKTVKRARSLLATRRCNGVGRMQKSYR